jgi:hypothetical protein
MKFKVIWSLTCLVFFWCFPVVPISSAAENEVTARDGTFVAYANGVVMDTKTGLEWVAGPDRETTWDEARDWAEQLAVDGGGWRMPIKEELKTLYQKGAGKSNLTPLLKTTGRWVWSRETNNSSLAWAVSFFHGEEHWFVRDTAHFTRGFAVRSK